MYAMLMGVTLLVIPAESRLDQTFELVYQHPDLMKSPLGQYWSRMNEGEGVAQRKERTHLCYLSA